MKPNMLYPALLGGLFIGVFSALPVISVGNLCCCLWLIVGGVLAAWLLQQNHAAPITPADGALVGVMAGIVGSFVYLLIALPVGLLFGPMMDRWMQAMVENAGDTPVREIFERYRGAGMRTFTVLANFVLHFVLGFIFPTLGGLLGAVLFRKAGPPMPPPPSIPLGTWTPPPPVTPQDTWTPPATAPPPGPWTPPTATVPPPSPWTPPELPPAAPGNEPPAPPAGMPPAVTTEPLVPPAGTTAPDGPLVSGPIEPSGPAGPRDERSGREGGSGTPTA